ncbi:MAG: cbb3-type cytochrome c oxidase subunit II [Bdellovibrionales bacterium]|nr:cbb3-type cytochrome c oxidase subunit II [Bdellovibrionales bacterium]
MRRMLLGVIAVAATYFYFLIFAQFAFLKLLEAAVVEPGAFDRVMGAMGLCGLLGSLAAAKLLGRHAGFRVLTAGFVLAVVAACGAAVASSELIFIACSGLIGLSLALITVSLAASLTTYFAVRHLGLAAGVGTGIAYFICNVPSVFSVDAKMQTWMAAVAASIGAVFSSRSRSLPEGEGQEDAPTAQPSDYQLFGFGAVVLVFLALVWLDSAAFYVIQQSGELRSLTWHGSVRLWLNAVVHLVAALIGGLLLDWGKLRETQLLAFLLLAAGVLALEFASDVRHLSGPLYCAGVSLYSTLLVAFPSRGGNRSGRIERRWRAAVLYAVAGWFGSAMGIGMAKDLERVPLLFLVVAGAVTFGLTVHHRLLRGRISASLGVLLFPVVPLSVTDACFAAAGDSTSLAVVPRSTERGANASPESDSEHVGGSALDALIVKGREVYIAEGCIHCHSQYVRPNTRDVEMWGPYIAPEEILRARPPLIGNRRSGPDLLNIGNRRSRDWLQIHLIEPRATQPGSTMPSYEYLFADERGERLLDYLQSLGRNTMQERLQQVQRWRPKDIAPISASEARDLFLDGCAACHGASGRGDGPLASRLYLRPRNLVEEPPRTFDWRSPEADLAYARLIKFGVPGSSMPGHEYYEDEEVLGLVRYLRTLAQYQHGN